MLFSLLQGGNPIVNVSLSNVIALTLAFLGFVGTVSMLVMNLKVTGSMATQAATFEMRFSQVELKIVSASAQAGHDYGQVQVELANLRTELAGDHARFLQSLQSMFVNRDVSTTMHAANVDRLDKIDARLQRIEGKINL